MTDVAKRRRRLSKGALRAFAWIAGGAAFAAPFASLTLSPKPATATSAAPSPGRRVIIVKKITRRVVVHPAPTAPSVQYVSTGSGSSGSNGSSPSSSSSSNGSASNSGSAGPPPASTSTGGS